MSATADATAISGTRSAAATSALAGPASTAAAVSLPPGSSGGVSDEMRALLDGYKKLHETILKVQSQIEEEEAAYLEDTAHGNIVRGWDGFIDSKQSRKDAALKKVKPYTEAEHLFSSCCHYRALAKEPTQDLVEFTPREETTSGRRRGLGSSSSTSSTAATSTPVLSRSNSSQKLALERKGSISGSSGTPAMSPSITGAAGPSSLGRPPKIKKRKRLDRLEAASTASATHSETGEDDDKEPVVKKKREGDDDFLDML
ncbi:hypothetical protein PINS_up022668 [Pythium insidiosum]|nr:hypothetical protein PINS_up001347 [Pythium insidiosum]GLE10523.1 hypothetical protein PINS_up022668 [Pythium insidiosum]